MKLCIDRITPIVLTALVGLVIVGSASPAGAEPPEASREPLAALNFLAGEWEGEGWSMTGPGQKETFRVEESVVWKLGGVVLLVEGIGRSVDPETGEEKVVHNALATVGHDAETGYTMRAFTSEGRHVDPEITVGDDTLVWGFEVPQVGEIRYTITLNEESQWFEVGEMSRDGGETWFQFFEMTLNKKVG